MSYELDWVSISSDLGFSSPKRMLMELYYVEGMSLREMGKKLGLRTETIRDKMERLRLPLRGRGGPNNSKKGPPCPRCSATVSYVTSCRMEAKGYTRYRKCILCGERFKTREVGIESCGSSPGPRSRNLDVDDSDGGKEHSGHLRKDGSR